MYSQNAGNAVSETLDFQNFPGGGGACSFLDLDDICCYDQQITDCFFLTDCSLTNNILTSEASQQTELGQKTKFTSPKKTNFD